MLNLNNFISTIHNSQKTLFILCGYPYAGKSYVANQLKSHADIKVVSIDDVFKANGFDWDTNNLPNDVEWQQIFDVSYEKTRVALRQGKNVLYDSTNQTAISRDKLRRLAKSVDANMYVLYIKTRIETVWKRWEENQNNQMRSIISRGLVQQTIDMFEEPTEMENAIVIDNDKL